MENEKENYQAKNVWNIKNSKDISIAQDKAKIIINNGTRLDNSYVEKLINSIKKFEEALSQPHDSFTKEQLEAKVKMLECIPDIKQELEKPQPNEEPIQNFKKELSQSPLQSVSALTGIISMIIALIDLVFK
ncbi:MULTISPECIES: hypothetical protein [unclassified Thermoactinomyces]|jgi:hypothetical protein|uniref:hypothetical protein n=1 Tax=unclassified Thermoactinomyces TaxID=2634588 RepID=UPI0018DDA06F|nr:MULTISPECIES: hypothetical protein [unclassified Thermoactinomyces]MBH8597477.1 hypothetical protein [Thermoactinomyces sp. CICC 10523]MBH8608574.1 hypothetical protein [Thermoactinomyces sp. CICC 10521]